MRVDVTRNRTATAIAIAIAMKIERLMRQRRLVRIVTVAMRVLPWAWGRRV
jgi:hypothetical protein